MAVLAAEKLNENRTEFEQRTRVEHWHGTAYIYRSLMHPGRGGNLEGALRASVLSNRRICIRGCS